MGWEESKVTELLPALHTVCLGIMTYLPFIALPMVVHRGFGEPLHTRKTHRDLSIIAQLAYKFLVY